VFDTARILLWSGLNLAVRLFFYLYWRWAANQLRVASALLGRDDRVTLGEELYLASDREALGVVALNPGLALVIAEVLDFLRVRIVVHGVRLKTSFFDGGLPSMALTVETSSSVEEMLAVDEAVFNEVMDRSWLTGGGLLPPRMLAGLFFVRFISVKTV
jgi:hypothetical protein